MHLGGTCGAYCTCEEREDGSLRRFSSHRTAQSTDSSGQDGTEISCVYAPRFYVILSSSLYLTRELHKPLEHNTLNQGRVRAEG